MGLYLIESRKKKHGIWIKVGNFFTGWATSGFDKDNVYPAALEAPWVKGEPNVKNINFFVGNFGMDSVLLIEGSVLDPCCEI